MSRQIAVRLPEDIVDFMDDLVRHDHASSRADVVTRALRRERSRLAAQRDAAILSTTEAATDDDLDALAAHVAQLPMDVEQLRAIHLAQLDKTRPVLILTRDAVRPYLNRVTVAPITSTVRGLSTEVPVGSANGLDHESVVSCDNIVTVPVASIGRLIGHLHHDQEPALTDAIRAAFDLS